MRKYNIFVVGLEDFEFAQLQTLAHVDTYVFHPLFSRAELRREGLFPVRWLIEEGETRLRAFPDTVDAIVGYWDFPVSTILPILRQRMGLPTPSLESVLKCEHKYWSRLEQQHVIPAQIPRFCAVNPFADDPLAQIDLEFPFWIKPVKAALSHLGYRINDRHEFNRAIAKIRSGIGRFGEPFNYILSLADLPPQVADVDGYHCIAESLVSTTRQCTVEGYAYRGRIHCYGTIDSLREGPVGSSFSRYQYPSVLPLPVQERMAEIAGRVIRHIGYNDAPFNIEFYWDEDSDNIYLLEINSRISKSHAPLFYLVDGCYHYQVMVDLAMGRAPEMPHRQGEYRIAAKFMLRRYEDARVVRMPADMEIAAVEHAVPGVSIRMAVTLGMWLSELPNQDSYTYEIATIFIGADDVDGLERKYRQVLDRLPLKFEPAEAVAGHLASGAGA